MRLTLKAVNDELSKHGEERLERGNGYFFFHSGTAHKWEETSVPVFRLRQLSIEQWVAERNKKFSEYSKYYGSERKISKEELLKILIK